MGVAIRSRTNDSAKKAGTGIRDDETATPRVVAVAGLGLGGIELLRPRPLPPGRMTQFGRRSLPLHPREVRLSGPSP